VNRKSRKAYTSGVGLGDAVVILCLALIVAAIVGALTP
jgi:hypothetical protein